MILIVSLACSMSAFGEFNFGSRYDWKGTATNEPADFMSFWSGIRTSLNAVAINPIPASPVVGSAYALTLDQLDGRKVYGYVSMPGDASGSKKYPAIVEFPAYGTGAVSSMMADDYKNLGAIGMAITIHNANPDVNGYSPDDPFDRSQNYMRWAVAACMRSLDYIASLPMWNGQIAVSGESQGGYLSLAMAALDNRVTTAYTMVSAWGDQTRPYLNGVAYPAGFYMYWKYLIYDKGLQGTGQETTLMQETKYYDTLYFCNHVRTNTPLVFMANAGDVVVDHATVYAACNHAIGSPKIVIEGSATQGHNSKPSDMWETRKDFMANSLTGTYARTPWHQIDAGPAKTGSVGTAVALTGSVKYRGTDQTWPVLWTKLSGPGNVTFGNATSKNTTATFGTAGTYWLRLSSIGNPHPVDSNYTVSLMDDIRVTIGGSGPRGVPHTWLDLKGLTNYTDDAEAEEDDPDLDGMQTWKEYYAGTDPTNAGSVFRIQQANVQSAFEISWLGGTNNGVLTPYSVYRCTDLVTSTWDIAATNIARSESGVNVWTDASPLMAPSVFFRIAVTH